ncbi:MAG: hypothetical protein LBB66_10895 [Desulfovibrio sp.]|nr:hypothetical protein [Desulfovibrio sp.]
MSYTLRRTVADCPRPAPPALPALDPQKRLEHPANLARLTLAVDLMASHIADQDAALDCYERQAGGN